MYPHLSAESLSHSQDDKDESSGESRAHWLAAASSCIYFTIMVLDPEDIYPVRCSDRVAW